MTIENKNLKHYLISSVPVFIVVFLIASTNTLAVISGLTIYIVTVLLIYLISFYTDKKLKSNFNSIALTLLIVSVVAIGCGVSTFSIQQKLNFKKATKFVAEIEKFKRLTNRLPKGDTEIKIPASRNGLYVEEFEYSIPEVGQMDYIIKYFDGFWNTKVYVSSRKKWFTDD